MVSAGSRATSVAGGGAGVGDDVEVLRHPQQPQRGAAAGLGGAEDVALAALLEVELGQAEAVGRGGEGLDALQRPGVPGSAVVTARHTPGLGAAADAPAQLVQLGQAEAVGVEDRP